MENADFRLDMADECVVNGRNVAKTTEKKIDENVYLRSLVIAHDDDAKIFKRDKGKYVTVEVRDAPLNEREEKTVVKTLKDILRDMCSTRLRSKPKVLIAGLGNRAIIADSVGPLTVDNINVHGRTEVFAFSTGIFSMTGMESATVVRAIAKETDANVVIVIGTLATSHAGRIFRSFQVTDAGLEPGSATMAGREKITFGSVGVPVIAIGVPTCVYARQLVNDALSRAEDVSVAKRYDVIHEVLGCDVSMILAPKNVEEGVRTAARIISDSVNGCFCGRR